MPDSAETAAELLEAVNAAILQVLTRGQEVVVAGRRYTRANLNDLRALRDELAEEEIREERGGIRLRQVVPRG
jgi:hypothetical protein